MPAGSEVFAFGLYTITYGGTSVGLTMGAQQSPTQDTQGPHGEMVNNTTTYGQTIIDGFYTGFDHYLSMTMMEWIAGSKTVITPFDSTLGEVGVIGVSFFDSAAAVVMTALANTPAAAAGPATRTASKCILAPDQTIRQAFGTTHRILPVRLLMLPHLDTQVKWFVDT